MLKHKKFTAKRRIQIAAALSAAIAVAVPISVRGWFVERRRVGDIAKIHSPNVLSINAAKEQDIEYLDLSSIDLKKMATDENGDEVRAKYFVFCICGSDTKFYNIQLAYTTNNQFEYHLYPAVECSSSDDYLYVYQERDDSGKLTPNKYYYKKSTQDQELTGTNKIREYNITSAGLLNPKTGEILGNKETVLKNDITYFSKTYEGYDKVEEHAMPLYWQAKDIRSGVKPDDPDSGFADYYILEVNWQTAYNNSNLGKPEEQKVELSNSRETDIIYITAKSSLSKVPDENKEQLLAERYTTTTSTTTTTEA